MIVSIDNSSDVGKIFTAVSRLKGVADVRLQEDTETHSIPGLSYTYEERMKDIRKAEEDYTMGRTVTTEELKKRIILW